MRRGIRGCRRRRDDTRRWGLDDEPKTGAASRRDLTPPAPLSRPPPRRPGERGAPKKSELPLAVLPLLPDGGGEDGRRGPG
jgi:hypothetical protein